MASTIRDGPGGSAALQLPSLAVVAMAARVNCPSPLSDAVTTVTVWPARPTPLDVPTQPSTEHSRPSIPDGLPPAEAVTYCVPAVDGASVGPENETLGVLLSMSTVFA